MDSEPCFYTAQLRSDLCHLPLPGLSGFPNQCPFSLPHLLLSLPHPHPTRNSIFVRSLTLTILWRDGDGRSASLITLETLQRLWSPSNLSSLKHVPLTPSGPLLGLGWLPEALS